MKNPHSPDYLKDQQTKETVKVPTNEKGVVVRPALELLNRLRRGQVMDLLSLEINRVVNAVKDTTSGKGGTVTLAIKIDPIKKIANAVQIQAVVVGKCPEDPPTVDILWYDDEGNLHSRDPNQGHLFEEGPQDL